MKFVAIFVLGTIITSGIFGQSDYKWFDGESISSTVFLEKEQSGKLVPHGTGFVILSYKSKDQIIVTCEHLLHNSAIYVTLEVNERFRTKFRSLTIKQQQAVLNILKSERNLFWNPREDFLRIKIQLIKDSTFFVHPSGLDIGAFKINIPGEISFGDSTYKVTDVKMIGKSRIKNRENINLGDDTYFIGFPFGIGSPQPKPSQLNYTSSSPKHLLRKGVISWISDDYDEFLLDAMSFGGNSGSPLFQVSFEPNKPPHYLIGIIIGHLGDGDSNFGLARCLSTGEINRVIELADK